MPKYRPSPAALTLATVALLVPLAAWSRAQNPIPPAATPVEPPTEAETQLDAAIKQVAALRSVSADVAQKVDMLDLKFSVEGRYLKAPNHRVYLRLDVTGLPDAAGTMLQVCDGQTLWDYQKILEAQVYRKVEVAPVFEKLESQEIDATLREQIAAQLGFAGPEELLAGLRRSVKFDQKESGTLDGKDVWVVRGGWKNRNGLLGPNQQPLPATAALPAYVPSLVTIYLGKDDGWPYKVTLVGKIPSTLIDSRPVGSDGRPMGRLSAATKQQVQPTRIDLTYTNVKFNPDLKVEEFVFEAPREARVEDSTQAILSTLDQAIQMRAAQRKTDAAKGTTGTDDAVLKEAIDVPKTGASALPPGSVGGPPAK